MAVAAETLVRDLAAGQMMEMRFLRVHHAAVGVVIVGQVMSRVSGGHLATQSGVMFVVLELSDAVVMTLKFIGG